MDAKGDSKKLELIFDSLAFTVVDSCDIVCNIFSKKKCFLQTNKQSKTRIERKSRRFVLISPFFSFVVNIFFDTPAQLSCSAVVLQEIFPLFYLRVRSFNCVLFVYVCCLLFFSQIHTHTHT